MIENELERKYSDEIKELRFGGNPDAAIVKCKEATNLFPTNNYFYKVLGDMLFEKGHLKDASLAYLNQLKHLEKRPEQFKNFARFYQKLTLVASKEFMQNYYKLIREEIQLEKISPVIQKELIALMGIECIQDKEIYDILSKIDNDKYSSEVISFIDKKKDKYLIYIIVSRCIETTNRTNCRKIDDYLVSMAERYELYDEALGLIEKICTDNENPNPTVIRTLLRICRKQKDYSRAEKLLTIDAEFVEYSDFNIQYELVYYFDFIHDENLLEETLKKMRNSATRSIPIARTLYNFYLRFDKFDDAREVWDHIKKLEAKTQTTSKNKRIEEQFEAEQEIWDKLQNLVSEQEHNRQMIAIRELLKGFSHELGQPITNIRYSVQLHQMKKDKGLVTDKSTEELLDLILEQTERIGGLLNRFRPVVSSKSKEEIFSIYSRIKNIFSDLSTRLDNDHIEYYIEGDETILIWGDPIQFDQIFYNLILNSMQAIAEDNLSGWIRVKITHDKKEREVRIDFWDNGPGIMVENTKKIFEPFFSTKEPSSSDGGEGLGLFIVWNILKMFNGSISVDEQYKNGAKFIIRFKLKER